MKRFLTGLTVLFLPFVSANAKVFDVGTHTVSNFSDPENIIESDAVVNAKFINPEIDVVQSNVSLVNKGTVNGDININGNNFTIQNSGVLNGKIVNHSSNFGFINQIIASDKDFKSLNVDSGIDLWANITDITNTDLQKIQNLGANHFIISGSEIYLQDFSDWQNWNADVLLNGKNCLHIQNINTVNSGEVIGHVLSVDNIDIDIQDIDVLHKVSLDNTAEGVVLNIIRETNYKKIFDDGRGVLLETLRANNADNKFISKLDSVDNMSELKSVMNSSYRFNHKLLIRPLKTLNNFMLTDHDSDTQDIQFNVGYIGGDKTSVYGGFSRIGGFYENLYLGLGVNVNKLKYSDDVNDFDVLTYGGHIKSRLNFNDWWINGIVGFSIADYKADNIYFENSIKNNPHGRSLFGAFDAGYKFDLNKDFNADLFAGINCQNSKVLNVNEFDANLRIGSDIKYSYEIIGIKYNYSVGGAIATNGDLYGSVKLGFWSVADESGASFNFDVIKSEYDLNYQISLNSKTMF